MPQNYYAAKTLTIRVGLDYKNIHVCGKRCVLFRGKYKDVINFPKCGTPRYKDEGNKLYLVKVIKHFPINPRLQRMFRTPAMSSLMLWHAQNNSLDGLVKHPCDSKAWKHINERFPRFALDVRNVHLGLIVNGVNPYKLKCSTWSTWPIMLLNYNIPPWLTTNKFFVILALLIPRKQSITSNNFDVYF